MGTITCDSNSRQWLHAFFQILGAVGLTHQVNRLHELQRGCSTLLTPSQHHLKMAGKLLPELIWEREMLAAPARSQVHLMFLLLLEAVINFIVSLCIILLSFEAVKQANAVQDLRQ